VKKTLGILFILVIVCVWTALVSPNFLGAYNLENLLHRISLFGLIGVGVAFVIVTGGIDLSIGSLVGLVGTILPLLLVEHGFSPLAAVVSVLVLAALVGLLHGLLITRLHLQPFVVTLCGLLFYRGFARYLTDDQTLGFGSDYDGLRQLAVAKPCSLGTVLIVTGALLTLFYAARKHRGAAAVGALLVASGIAALTLGGVTVRAPAPLLALVGVTVLAHVAFEETLFGRHLLALGRSEEAARYNGIAVDRTRVIAYVVCSTCAGLAGVLWALDVNSVQPAVHGNFYELYAIAAAVLGGCSLRGGEGSIPGVLIGTALLIVLKNVINLLGISHQLEFAIIGAVILIGVVADELIRAGVERRRARQAGG